jgi:iron complex outermembrane receptor protein
LGDNLFLTGGLRYSTERKNAIFYNAPAFAGDGPFTVKSHALTPRAVIRYAVDDRSNVYASVSKGFKSGFVNASAPFGAVRPEKITAYEVGYKTARRVFRFDVSAYYYDYKDLQVSTVFIGALGTQQSITTNAATAKIYGGEAQIMAQPLPALNITAGLGYTHARYGNYSQAVANATGLAACAGLPVCVQNWSGLRIARSPDWTANLGVDYTIPLSFGDLVLAGNASYQSFFLPSRTDKGLNGTGYRYGQPATGQLSLQASWNSPNKDWRLTAFGNNLTNTHVAYSKAGQSFGDTVSYDWPRTYGARIEYNF